MSSTAALVFTTAAETVRIEPWGPHSVRVRAAADPGGVLADMPGALDLPPSPTAASVDGGRLVNGQLTVEVTDGRIRFLHTGS
ncbi:MAG TPA: family 31 glucosidase, partial [Phytomonospora sp.]